MRIFVPRFVSMGITLVQLGQMLIAVGLNLYALWMKGIVMDLKQILLCILHFHVSKVDKL